MGWYVVICFISLLALCSLSEKIGEWNCMLKLGEDMVKRDVYEGDPKDLEEAKHAINMKVVTLRWVRQFLVWGHIFGIYFLKN